MAEAFSLNIRRAGDADLPQLVADRNNLPALDFYRHLGWRPTELGAWHIALATRA